MVDEEAQSCTLCGTVANRKYLFEKINDNRSVGSIKVCRCCACKNIYLWKYKKISMTNYMHITQGMPRKLKTKFTTH